MGGPPDHRGDHLHLRGIAHRRVALADRRAGHALLQVPQRGPARPDWEDRDRFILSKGHGGIG
ncbi:MAG TPA: hypothetical protein PK380_00630, partial [Deltaproteobacteria bacterium]|nr:hypothetical protein [Deltaproteobacteria bacterium]